MGDGLFRDTGRVLLYMPIRVCPLTKLTDSLLCLNLRYLLDAIGFTAKPLS